VSQLFAMKITAMGEVRDADGNLLSTTPVESVVELTEQQVRELFEGEAE
jgi:hypothetical protein